MEMRTAIMKPIFRIFTFFSAATLSIFGATTESHADSVNYMPYVVFVMDGSEAVTADGWSFEQFVVGSVITKLKPLTISNSGNNSAGINGHISVFEATENKPLINSSDIPVTTANMFDSTLFEDGPSSVAPNNVSALWWENLASTDLASRVSNFGQVSGLSNISASFLYAAQLQYNSGSGPVNPESNGATPITPTIEGMSDFRAAMVFILSPGFTHNADAASINSLPLCTQLSEKLSALEPPVKFEAYWLAFDGSSGDTSQNPDFLEDCFKGQNVNTLQINNNLTGSFGTAAANLIVRHIVDLGNSVQ